MIFRISKVAGLGLALIAMSCAPVTAEEPRETLVYEPPQGFKQVRAEKGEETSFFEYTLKADAAPYWSEMFRVSIVPGAKHTEPRLFADQIAEGGRRACVDSTFEDLGITHVNGYPAIARVLRCPKDKQTGLTEDVLLLAIQGREAFYSIMYHYSSHMNDDEKHKTEKYIRTITLCDTRRADNPCPAGM